MNREEILRLEKLARLQLTEEERSRLAPQIEEVIAFFNQLQTLNTEGVEPLVHLADVHNVLREDRVSPSLSAEEITKNADTEDGFFVVPCAVEEGTE